LAPLGYSLLKISPENLCPETGVTPFSSGESR
jgi:hypothetical protein